MTYQAGLPFPFHQWEMQGYDRPIYANVEYPHANIPPFIDARRGFNYGGKNYGINPVGSYVRTFEVPENWNGNVRLSTLAVSTAQHSFICNGKYVGYTQEQTM